MGELSDLYDTCTKVSEKREIAKLVVEAVYGNGGRFLDSDGHDIGFKRSMDKAMKALKDRRHIKSRKQNGLKLYSDDAIRKDLEAKRAASATAARLYLEKERTEKDPMTTDGAGHALLLLNLRKPEDGTEKPRDRGENETSMKPPPKMTAVEAQGTVPQMSNLTRAESGDVVYQYASSPASVSGLAWATEQSKGSAAGEMPVLWQSVIVSRESPQASLADMLVNAKQRLDALSSIQQAVSAPICLIYPPNPSFSLAGELSAGQAAVAQTPVNQEFVSAIPHTGVQQVSLQR